MRTMAQINREWRDGDHMISAEQAAELMRIPLKEFLKLDAGEKPRNWPNYIQYDATRRLYSYMDIIQYINTPFDVRTQRDLTQGEMDILHINLDLCDGSDIEYAKDVCYKATIVADDIGTDTLECLVKEGPLEEGCMPSNVQRERLLAIGLITPIVVRGKQGHWAANYTGQRVLAIVEHRRALRKA